ncbi:winged helix-turn-helix domain-containing protein [Halopelagius longus]|uniref:ArsR family transcriptional regulator n=1 Tax=Halopelagius longus TaxID=1236180 RepID=A0A1H1BS85_9EURY|nr:helix-turn-helix domain-containing protein [Halopelagius longus]RDI70902.1 ArsR family transcriptional regulator [Halopelagius longus]SDQ54788.1 Helix-turn-helix domain-containing protein [Halopelagius longus]
MAREQSASESAELDSVFGALDDADARDIIRTLDEPMTASEISDDCDIPLSTTYRKLDLLTDANLLLEGTEIRSDGHHATTYEVAFEEVRILLTDERDLSVDITRTERSPEERLADIWTAVREET